MSTTYSCNGYPIFLDVVLCVNLTTILFILYVCMYVCMYVFSSDLALRPC